MRSLIAAAGIAAALAGGSVAGLALANDSDAAAAGETTTLQTQNERPAPDECTGGHRRAGLQDAAEVIGVDAETLRAQLRDGQTLAQIAEANGIATDALVGQLTERANERLDQAVQDEKLTQEEAAERRAELSQRIEDRVNADAPPMHRAGRGGPAVETAARVIGVDETSLRADLRTGQSLADVAEANDVEPQTVVDALTDERTEHIEQEVDDGRLTEQQAAERLDGLSEHVEAHVNGEHPPPPTR